MTWHPNTFCSAGPLVHRLHLHSCGDIAMPAQLPCAVPPMQVLLATDAAEAGFEALLKYSSNSSASFLAMHGFVPERNPCAALELFENVREAAAWAAAACPPSVRPSSSTCGTCPALHYLRKSRVYPKPHTTEVCARASEQTPCIHACCHQGCMCAVCRGQ